jgi:hypothetical protein
MSSRIVELLEKSRPGKGDAVVYEGEKYIIEECGMKYYIVHPEDKPASKQWLRHNQVFRWSEPMPSETADRDWRTPVLKRESSHRIPGLLETEPSGNRGDTREPDHAFTS